MVVLLDKHRVARIDKSNCSHVWALCCHWVPQRWRERMRDEAGAVARMWRHTKTSDVIWIGIMSSNFREVVSCCGALRTLLGLHT